MAKRGRPKNKEVKNTYLKDNYNKQGKSYTLKTIEPTLVHNTPKFTPSKSLKYTPAPIVMVFKTSNRKNAKTKIKVWNSYNIDYILSQDKLPGVPDNAEILEIGLGKIFIDKYKQKYKID